MRRMVVRALVCIAACGAVGGAGARSLAQGLTLIVIPATGDVSIVNPSFAAEVTIDAYEIHSVAGSLVPDPTHTEGTGWDSLSDSGVAGWEEATTLPTELAELNFDFSTAVNAGGRIRLGKAFEPGAAADLTWGYTSAEGGTVSSAPVVNLTTAYLRIVRWIGANGATEGYSSALANATATAVDLDTYAIKSDAGSLDPDGFHGLAEQGVPGWNVASASATNLAEFNFAGNGMLPAGNQRILGAIFADGAAQDLTFRYHTVADEFVDGPVVYNNVLAGDVNENGVVDIFDVNTVSETWGTTSIAGDANWDGVVDIFDVNHISDHWGNTLPTGGATPVPEPASALLGLIAAAVFVYFKWRPVRRLRAVARLCPGTVSEHYQSPRQFDVADSGTAARFLPRFGYTLIV